MKTNRYLLPSRFQGFGWVLSIPTAIALLLYLFGKPWDAVPPSVFPFVEPWYKVLYVFTGDSIVAAISMALLMIGLLFIAFSKERIEDEYIMKLRGDSLIWAVVANALLLIVASLFVYGGWFMYVSLFNLYGVLALYIIKYKFALHNLKKNDHDEK